MRIRTESMYYTSEKNKWKRKHIKELEKNLITLETDYEKNETEENLQKLTTTRYEIEKIYEEKTAASMFRSKCDWSEHGERNSKYFLNLESYNYSNKNISYLNVDGKIVTDEQEIGIEIKKYYENLYAPNTTNPELLKEVLKDIPTISNEDKKLTEGLITYDECLKSLKTLPNGKTPGIDGITTDFYQFF